MSFFMRWAKFNLVGAMGMGCAGFFAEQHALISYNIVPGEPPESSPHQTICVLLHKIVRVWQISS